MRLRVLLFISVIVLIVGEQANGRKPELPDELMKAKTLCLDVQLVGLRGEGNLKVKETASEALKKWGRFDLAPNCGSADAVLYVMIRDFRGGESPLIFTIIGQHSGQTLYSTQTRDCSLVSSCIKGEITTLRKTMEKQGN